MKAKYSNAVAAVPPGRGPTGGRSPVVVAGNTAWNLAHFRRPVIERLVAEGYPVMAAAAPDDSVADLRGLGCTFEPLPLEATGRSPLADLRLLAAFVALLRRHRPAALLTFTVKPNIYGGLAARSSGTPAIATVTGLGSSFLAGGPLAKLVAALYKPALGRAQAIMFQNRNDRDDLLAAGLVRPEQARMVAGSGIDLTHFAPVPLPGGRPLVFLLVGRLLRDKGVVEYVEAARILRERGVGAVCRIVGAVGTGNPSAVPEAELARWVSDGLVEHHPPVADIRAAIAAADCLVLPSYREGLPRSLLEGMAMARPLIATDVPGCREVVVHGDNGFLCRPRSAEDLSHMMLAMDTLSPAERTAMGMRGRAMAEQRFGADRVAAAYLAELER